MSLNMYETCPSQTFFTNSSQDVTKFLTNMSLYITQNNAKHVHQKYFLQACFSTCLKHVHHKSSYKQVSQHNTNMSITKYYLFTSMSLIMSETCPSQTFLTNSSLNVTQTYQSQNISHKHVSQHICNMLISNISSKLVSQHDSKHIHHKYFSLTRVPAQLKYVR